MRISVGRSRVRVSLRIQARDAKQAAAQHDAVDAVIVIERLGAHRVDAGTALLESLHQVVLPRRRRAEMVAQCLGRDRAHGGLAVHERREMNREIVAIEPLSK